MVVFIWATMSPNMVDAHRLLGAAHTGSIYQGAVGRLVHR